ncbi:pentapeptide repeat-containing protein [Amycolatopsis nalaikhensis]|uniref:Pentapeptide repeat-containing protein n=1 Tax=Amycolatopsis nalaikhensis TaxID=715472 RepID=A0ABY8XCV5_9PSEU|nr:pentapeptide repeat-containing protein [Amycolatopsis sp. 2-2]WIV52936.1 pentapeptide repeat-containing protein [Amycolatopsis sp. 2-2]
MLALGGLSLLVAVSVLLGWPDWAAVGRWGRPHAIALVLLAVTAVCVVAGIWLLRGGRAPSARTPVMSWWFVAGAAVVVIMVAWGAMSWLLGEASAATDVGAVRVDAIKTGLGIGAGTTGIFALLLAVRRQWHSEVDATEKNVTELYTKAADQLGSDQAPVRMAGLYALERLAHSNPGQRQSIVNVIWAYLRMPYTLPDDQPPEADTDEARVLLAEHRERTQEREVRLAAQRILTDHLNPNRPHVFWADIDLDLSNAHLIDFTLDNARTGKARFTRATFSAASFRRATFSDTAWFDYATFSSIAEFGDVTFDGIVSFDGATSDGAPFTPVPAKASLS